MLLNSISNPKDDLSLIFSSYKPSAADEPCRLFSATILNSLSFDKHKTILFHVTNLPNATTLVIKLILPITQTRV